MRIITHGPWLKDVSGRTRILRGVNLGGSSKVPTRPDGATHHPQREGDGFFDHRAVSFVGRPFPLEEADEHFARLAAWGLTFLRFVITWETVEHAGPGCYDSDYLDYLRAIVKKAEAYGLLVYIDPHQDVWSRYTGGDGAPGWTLEAVGFDIRRLHATGAAFLHQLVEGPLPGLIWPTNYTKLGAATMFTLFFGGDRFAPKSHIDGEPVQTYLQRHYFAALCEVKKRLADAQNVVGYGSMNEPSPGFIGLPLLEIPTGMLKKGASPTPLQSMLLGAGHPQEVEIWEMARDRMGLLGLQTVNAERLSVWRSGEADIWKLHGVFSDEGEGGARALRPDYFTHHNGQRVDFERDHLLPFCQRLHAQLSDVAPRSLFFFEGPPIPYGKPPPWNEPPSDVVHAPHWYDGLTLFTKHYNRELTLELTTMMPVFGADEVQASFGKQLGAIRAQLPQLPCLLGEFGLNYDLDDGQSYGSGDFSDQIEALDGYYRAIEANLLHSTQWNYTSDNSNRWGDLWNGEDLSIYSADQRRDFTNLDSGGRALAAVVRPYARAISGQPLLMSYDRKSRVFVLEFRHDEAVRAPTEIFVPAYVYPNDFVVEVSDGTFVRTAPDLLHYQPTTSSDVHRLMIRPLV